MAQVLCVSHQIDQVQQERCYFNVFLTQVTDGRALEDIRQLLLLLPTSVCTTLLTVGYLVRTDCNALEGIFSTKCFKSRHTQKLHITNNTKQGRDSSVDIAARYGLDGPGIESRWGGGRDFTHLSRPSLGPSQPLVLWVLHLFLGVDRPGRGADHPPI
jgi:hypothetical protein